MTLNNEPQIQIQINNNHNKPELETGTQFYEAYAQGVLNVQLE